jgi:hypothetical protein
MNPKIVIRSETGADASAISRALEKLGYRKGCHG